MRKSHGYATIVEPGKSPIEMDTAQCGHCQKVIFTKPGSASTIYLLPILPVTLETIGHYQEEPGAFCTVCMRPICFTCHAHGRCTPWEKMIDAAEDRERFRRSV